MSAHGSLVGWLILFSVSSFAQEVSLRGDPYQNEWRRSKQKSIHILSKIRKDFLLPSAPEAVGEWLSKVDEMGETTFAKLAKELEQSKITFTGPNVSNPDGVCGHTNATPGSPIQISKKDCGTLTERKRWETLIGDTAHHFGHGNDFSAWVGISVADAYEFMIASDPFPDLENRYRGVIEDKSVVVVLSSDHKRMLSVKGVVALDLTSLPEMKWKNLQLHTKGNYSSFNCETWGIGKDAQTGAIRYGALQGGDFRNDLKAEVILIPHGENGQLRFQINYELAPSNGGACRGVEESLWAELIPFPPTPEELAVIEQEKKAAKEVVRLYANWKLCQDLMEKGDVGPIAALLDSGIPKEHSDKVLQFAMEQGSMPLVEKMVSSLDSKQRNLTFEIIDSKNAAFVVQALQSSSLKPFIRFDVWRNEYSPIGYVVDLGQLRRKFELRKAWEDYVSEILPALFDAGADPMAATSRYSYRASHSLISAFYTPFPSQKIVGVLAKSIKDVDAANSYNRKAVDYLVFHWLLFKEHCKDASQHSVQAEMAYQQQLSSYRAIYDSLLENGSNGQRTEKGFLYFSRVSCSYSQERRGYQFFINTSYSTKPVGYSSIGG